MEGKRADGGRSEALRELRASRQSLKGIDLDGAILFGTDLAGDDLSYASLRRVELGRCNFDMTVLSQAKFEHGEFRDHCTFRNASFDRTDIRDALFADDDLSTALFTRAIADEKTSFNGATMSGATIDGSEFGHVIFDNTTLTKIVIRNSNISSATFLRADMNDCRLALIAGNGAQFQKAHLEYCRFQWASSFSHAAFDGSDLKEARFSNSDMSGASFFNAQLDGARFEDCDLRNADFTSSHLAGVTFVRCKIDGATFRDAKELSKDAFQDCDGKPREVSLY
jgi:uncharacterized protein YjbI with pentapeptide repeats